MATPTQPNGTNVMLSPDLEEGEIQTHTPNTSGLLPTNDNDEQDEDRGIVVNARDMPDEIPSSRKKKKKPRKPASKRGLGKPTGFEEFHADAPLTLEQFTESKEAFNPDIPFVDRVLKAIQRFERTRKLSPERRDIFYKYLAYGGVDVGPNMFVGAQNTEDLDKDQINTAMAQANISDETKHAITDPKRDEAKDTTDSTDEGSKLRSPEHLAKYVVDFEGTMQGFLSRHAPTIYAFDTTERVKLVTTTLERFMDYLLLHDVCPEYTTEILSTRNLCRAAETELWHCAEAERHLPGDFNIACSTLFGGSYSQNYDGETCWGPNNTGGGNVFVGLKPEQATQIAGFAIAGAASEDVYQKYLEITTTTTTTKESGARDFEVIKVTTDHGFEITTIEQPTQECLDLYKNNTTEFRPVGIMHAKFFKNPDAPPEDLTPAERTQLASSSKTGSDGEDGEEEDESYYTFFIESQPLLSLLRPGMRIEATIHELNCGVWFFDQVIRVLPSFDLWLENEMMIGWKEPRPVAGAPAYAWQFGGVEQAQQLSEMKSEGAGSTEEQMHGSGTGDEHVNDQVRIEDVPNGDRTNSETLLVTPPVHEIVEREDQPY